MKGRTHIVWIIPLLATLILIAAPASAQDVVWQYDAIMPWDAERLTNNNTLITEYGNHTVTEVNTTTKEIIWQYGTAGTSGSDPGQLNSPVDAQRLSGNNTLITDRSNHRVIEVNTTGAIVWQYGNGTSGSGNDELNNPMDAERLSNGNTLIADRFNNRVIEVNESKGIVWQYGITNPFDADRLSNGNTLIVEYTNHSVIEINTSDEIVWQYGNGTSGSGVNQLNNPMDAERLANGNTLIADYANDRVIEVRTSDYDPAEPDNNFTAASIVWEYGSNHPADAERLFSGSTLISEAGNNSVVEVAYEIDLLPTALEIPTLYDNMSNTIRVTILNNRTGEASSFNVSLSADGNPVDEVEVSGLDAGESTVVSLFWTPSATGDFELCVTADCDLEVEESDEDNNMLCENVTVLSFEHPCLNDTFDDETKIAETQYALMHDGDVEIDIEFLTWKWHSNPLATGLGDVGHESVPAIAFNITGDGRWNLISGRSDGYFSGFYWDGSQWISDSSLVAGLGSVGYWACSAPAIAFNITGDGRWNLISGNMSGEPHGWYWNGSQWISDSSMIAGLGGLSKSAIAFSITGDERWNLIAGGNTGYYWDGSQWISDSSLVAGLEGIGRDPIPTIAFNITGDGRWNAIVGEYWGGIYGFYWNGSQWISDSSLVAGIGVGYTPAPALAFNITGDGRWNVIVGDSEGRFHGFEWKASRQTRATITSNVIQPPYFKNWTVFNANDTMPAGTSITYKILDASNNTIMSVVDGQDISSITEPSIRLYAELTTTNDSITPVLHDWGVCWETGDVDLSPTTIETPTPLYANVTVISAVIANDGDAHSAIFDVSLYANSIEVDKRRIENAPPGDNTSVTFLGWTPPHAGNYSLTVIVDSDDEIAESNETNNELTKEVTVLPVNMRRLTFDPESSTGPGVATDSEGNVHVVWTEDGSIHYMKLAADGMVIIDKKVLPASSGDLTILIDPDDNLHVIFNGQGSFPDAYYMKLDNGGEVLIAPKKILSGHEILPLPRPWQRAFTIDSTGDIHAVEMYAFQQQCGNGNCYYDTIHYIKFDNEGCELLDTTLVTFGIILLGAGQAAPCDAVSIATDSDGSAHVVYNRGIVGGTRAELLDIYYLKVDSSGAVLKDVQLTTDEYESRYPVVSTDATGNTHIIWCDNRSGWDLYYMKLDSSGDVLIDSKQITFEGSRVSPVIDTESGILYAAWSHESNIHYMGFDTNGGMLINKTLISLEDGSSWEPGICAVQDGPHLVWTDNRDGNNEIYYAKVLLPENRAFILSPADKWTPRNVNATYTIGILNTMANTGTFELTLDNLDGADVAELSNSTITLDSFSIGEVILNVTDADVGDYRATVSVTSQTNPEINASATITTSVIVPEADLIITAIDAYHDDTGYAPYFNIPNEVDVEVENTGTGDAGAFNVCLYADFELVDKQTIPDLGHGSSTTVQFKWTPTGLDCEDGGTPITYTLKAIADCDNDTIEMNEANNESTTPEIVYWAGYSADEHINGVAWCGMLHGGLHYTTGDGRYMGLYSPGNSEDTVYSITLPAGASIELARLNVYYTWSMVSSTGVYPVMEVSITNTSGTYVVPINASYNDRPCDTPAIGYDYPFGNYVYDLTPYITGDGSYTVNVKNVGPAYYSFCIAAPGLVILYEDETKPECEFWILEGADLLEGGHRGGAGNLDLSECICNATFTGDIDTDKVDHATLGIVSAWGGVAWGEDLTSYYWFNDDYLGDGSMLGGYGSLYDRTISGISMYAGASGNAQVGVNVSDVISYIASDNNTLSFGDDGDSMMAANAFLVVEHGAGRPLAPLLIYGWVNYTDDGCPANDSDVVITNLNTSEVLAVETAADSNYYQAVTSSRNVSVGDLLNFDVSSGNSTEFNHAVTPEEMGDGGFEQNLTIEPGICGDVNDDGSVDMTDVMTLWYDIADYPYVDAYTISNAWAADVNCDGELDMTDVMTLWYDIADYPYVGAYEVGCCE